MRNSDPIRFGEFVSLKIVQLESVRLGNISARPVKVSMITARKKNEALFL